MKVYLESLGCRLNWSEVRELASQFAAAGHHLCVLPEQADAIVVNTCAVTASAERKTLKRISALSRSRSDARIALVGCYASLAIERCSDLPGVEWVIPNSRKASVVQAMGGPAEPAQASRCTDQVHEAPPGRRTRAFLKVQDGCDNRCTYCVTSRLRGPARSRPAPEIIRRARQFVEQGCREIVVTGLNLGSYGRDSVDGANLADLVKLLLDETDVARLRLSSIEPWDLPEGFLGLWADPRLCRQLHLPLQAGCDATLARMGRPITTADFRYVVEAARAVDPEMAITTDMIAGFPGEDSAAFQASFDFAGSMAFARTHVFSFSPRPGTPAAQFEKVNPEPVRHERAQRLRQQGAEHAAAYRVQFIGRRIDVLWENRRPDGRWPGLTSHYVRVLAASNSDIHNSILPTDMVRAENGHLIGHVCDLPTAAASADVGPIPTEE